MNKTAAQKVLEALGTPITLDDLVGTHQLTGVELGVRYPEESRYHPSDEANTIAFILDGITYVAVENPSDGYRSMLEGLELGTPDLVKNTFDPIAVTASYGAKDNRNTWENREEVLEFRDPTGALILEVGTDNADDYYPSFVANWRPEAIGTGKEPPA